MLDYYKRIIITMTKKCKIVFTDEVKAKVIGLDPKTTNKCVDKLKFLVPYRFHIASYRLGRWDGSIRFFDKNGNTYINLLEDIIPVIIDGGYDFDIEDNRRHADITVPHIDANIFADHLWPEGHFKEGEPIQLREDQVEAANIFADNRYALQVLATGFGKTLLTAAVCKVVEHLGRTITIVPSQSLVEQTADDFKLVTMDVGRYYADAKEPDHKHIVTTWQSLNEIIESGDAEMLHRLTDGTIQVIVDECHQAKSESLNNILGKYLNHVPLRRGFTGTVPKEIFDAKSIFANVGTVKNTVTAKQLQDKGILSKCFVNKVITKESKKFTTYDDESAWLNKNKDRLQFISEFTELVNNTGNTLVLVNNVETGEYLNDMIPNSTFVYGKVKVKERKSAYQSIQKSNNKVIIATYQVAAVGINIPRIFNLVMLEAGKSFVRVIQTIGRGIRVAKDKDFVNIWDISCSTKFSKKHLKERVEYYDEAEYPHKEILGTYIEILEHITGIQHE